MKIFSYKGKIDEMSKICPNLTIQSLEDTFPATRHHLDWTSSWRNIMNHQLLVTINLMVTFTCRLLFSLTM